MQIICYKKEAIRIKLTIDTKEDSPETIRKAIAMLSALIEGKVKHSSIFDDASLPSTSSSNTASESIGSAFSNMFGSDAAGTSALETKTVKKEVPRVIEY